jgi:hypothetical protein
MKRVSYLAQYILHLWWIRPGRFALDSFMRIDNSGIRGQDQPSKVPVNNRSLQIGMCIPNAHHLALLFALLICISCGNDPQVVRPVDTVENTSRQTTGVFSSEQDNNANSEDNATSIMHEVKVLEVLPTDKYVYLNVIENDEAYWIATRMQNIEVGQRYFYNNGLLKTNFESKEYNRIFEKVYLVGNLVPVSHGQSTEIKQPKSTKIPSKNIHVNIAPKEGSIKIAEILKSPSKFKGKQVQVTGTCVKINANIMGRNWIHLQDGSQDDYDFVLTSSTAVPEGHVITMIGTLNLDRDFGSGYRYDVLIENAEIVH